MAEDAEEPAFMVSAPGKVIVFGEHAAVYGKPAIAAAISLRSHLLVSTLDKPPHTVRLNFRDIGLDHTWDLDALPWRAFHDPCKTPSHDAPVTSLDPELSGAIEPHAEAVSRHLPEKQRKIHVRSATAFLYLFLSLGSPAGPGATYTLRSTIPTGAGLGSSASVHVCLSAALLLQARAVAVPHPGLAPEAAEAQVGRINRWAFVGELCIHGDPSGVDNTVSAGGKAAVFRRACPGAPSVTPITRFPKLPLLLVDTRQARSTATQVARVRAMQVDHPVMTELILDGIGRLTTLALELLSSADFDGAGLADALARLGTLVRVNHGFLVSLGVSHPRLERVRELVDHADMGWTKLTGAGGGGCAITLFRPGVADGTIAELGRSFAAEGFQTYETVLGADGVGVLWPAVTRHGIDDGAGEEMSHEKFENAIGTQAIEQLVGLGAQGNREGWKFWQ